MDLGVSVRDPTARLADLYAAHSPSAGRLAYLLTGDKELAEDTVQEAFARMAIRIRFLRKPAAFETYLRRTIVNLCRGYWRRQRTERSFLEREGPRAVSESTSPPDLESRDEIWRALLSLPYRQRAALVLRYYEDLSEQGIADVLGCAPGTVKSLVSRGLAGLRNRLGGEPQC